MRTEIIYEDHDLLIIRKPAGLATQTAKVGQNDVVSELKTYLARKEKKAGKSAGTVYLGVIHRLDQPVEGLLVFAKTKETAAKLTSQLCSGEDGNTLNKQYLAVVCGKPSETERELVDYLKKTSDARAQVVDEAGGNAQKAVLHYEVLRTLTVSDLLTAEGKDAVQDIANRAVSLVKIVIETGRFHQIRAQMSHAGLPLLGDSKYGNETSMEISAKLDVRTVALCAKDLSFVHPVTHRELAFSCKPQGRIFQSFE